MTHEQKEAQYLIETFEEFGMNKENALLASWHVASGRYSEAIVHSLESSRADYWERVMDALQEMNLSTNTKLDLI